MADISPLSPSHRPDLTLDEGLVRLQSLVSEIRQKTAELNEAETRFQFIDRFLVECLGWPRQVIKLEVSHNGTYSDYELGVPRQLLWEAKREGLSFELPAGSSRRLVQSIGGLAKVSEPALQAIEQAQGYCAERGIPYAVVSNSHQLIMFLAVRQDGKAPLHGQCVVIDGYDAMLSNFGVIWQMLSPAGVGQQNLTGALRGTQVLGIPQKLSTLLQQYPQFRYPSESQQSLRVLSDLLIEDAPNTPEVEKRFYEECYCESEALSQEALVSREILLARYAALFKPDSPAPAAQTLTAAGGQEGFSSEVVAEALGRRPIVLVGDVGVGKSSFQKHLYYVTASAELQQSLYLQIDLGTHAALSADIRTFFLEQVEVQLAERYQIDIYENLFVRGVHFSVIQRFERGIHGPLKQTAPEEYERKLVEQLEAAIANKVDHLRACIRHISRGQKKQVVIFIDNADQRTLEVQQEAFLVAQELAKTWDALVFIAARPSTFHQSRRSGTLSAYPQRIITISPPRPELVLERRLVFALEMAEGRLPVEKLHGVSLKLDAIALFLRALLESLRTSPEIKEFLSNITAGNIRQIIEFVTRFVGSANVNSDRIIEIMRVGGRYHIPLHEFQKAAILGEYAHYDPESSLAFNLFDVRYPDPSEHFLPLLILAYLNYDSPARNREGFIETSRLIDEMQRHGFVPDQCENALRRLTNKKLIEATERITFEEGLSGPKGDMPVAFRLTTIGAYHLQKWSPTFAYMDGMAFDTPIFDAATMEVLARQPNSFDIAARLERTRAFRSYLNSVWDSSGITAPYFDWKTLIPSGQTSFDAVELYVERRTQLAQRTR
jgi:hypothetical protein